jgi:prefoldin subunit 5
MNDRGPNDLERTIERLEKRVEELKQDNLILTKEIDRLSEYNTNLETMLKK